MTHVLHARPRLSQRERERDVGEGRQWVRVLSSANLRKDTEVVGQIEELVQE